MLNAMLKGQTSDFLYSFLERKAKSRTFSVPKTKATLHGLNDLTDSKKQGYTEIYQHCWLVGVSF